MTAESDSLPPAAAAPLAEQPCADSVQFRASAALFATGIAVVTVADGHGGVHGVTVNSFTSISLDPPTVMVSLKAGRAHELISAGRWYGVSVLKEGQQNISRYFTGRRDDNSWTPQYAPGHPVPTLVGSLAQFECQVIDAIPVGDHTLFLAHVVRCESQTGSPLMFFASAYHEPTLGER